MNDAVDILDTKQAARFLGIPPRTLESWRYRGQAPQFIRYNKSQVRYRIADLEAFQRSKIVTPADEDIAAA